MYLHEKPESIHCTQYDGQCNRMKEYLQSTEF